MFNEQATDLTEQAIDLLQSLRGSEAERQQAVQAFCQQSEQHKRACLRAQRFLNAAEQIKEQPLSFTERCSVALSLQFEKLIAPNKGFIIGVTSSALVCLIVLLLNLTQQPSPGLSNPKTGGLTSSESYATSYGQRKKWTLDDGSNLWLDWESEVKVKITAKRRDVILVKGKASFNVVSDSEQPFIVSTGKWKTKVTGTQFTVSKQFSDYIQVEVLEGSVTVTDSQTQSVELTAQQRVEAGVNGLSDVVEHPMEIMQAWRNGVLIFREKPLVEVVKELSPYLPFELDLSYVPKAEERVNATFFTEQALEGFSTLLASHDLKVEKRYDGSMAIKVNFARALNNPN